MLGMHEVQAQHTTHLDHVHLRCHALLWQGIFLFRYLHYYLQALTGSQFLQPQRGCSKHLVCLRYSLQAALHRLQPPLVWNALWVFERSDKMNNTMSGDLRILGRTNSVKPWRLAQLVAWRIATAGAPRYRPSTPFSLMILWATWNADTSSLSLLDAATQAVTTREVGPITRAWAAPPPAPDKNPTKLGGMLNPMLFESMGDTYSERNVCNPSLAASRTDPENIPSTIRGESPDQRENTPRSRRIVWRIWSDDGEGDDAFDLFLSILSNTTLDFQTSRGFTNHEVLFCCS